MNITIRHLRAALAVARHASFRHAADEINLSQPAVSLAIIELERNLGVTLFDRTSRMVRITDVGNTFLASASRVIGDFDRLTQDIGTIALSRRGRVIVGCLSSIAGRVMPEVIRECEQRYPAIEIQIRDDAGSSVLELVRYGEADLGVAVQWKDPHEEMIFEPLLKEAFHVVCTRDHRLAKMKQVRWQQLSGETMIELTAKSSIYADINDELIRNGVSSRRKISVSQLATVNGMLEAGYGISVLPQLALPVKQHPTLVARPLVDPSVGRTIGVLRRQDKSMSPAAQGFYEVLCGVIRGIPGTWIA
jgi:DNA-binding transcriptional LysR family regulator